MTGAEVAASVLGRNAIAAMMSSVARVNAPVHITLSLPCVEQKRQNPPGVKYWEIIADNLSQAGWSWGCVLAVDSRGHTIFQCRASPRYPAASLVSDEIPRQRLRAPRCGEAVTWCRANS